MIVEDGRVLALRPVTVPSDAPWITPGLVDAHLHSESALLPPCELGRLAAAHGTVACVCDPHEIANVLGVAGVRHLIEDSRHSPVRFLFAAPSTVPATDFETSGARLGVDELRQLIDEDGCRLLGEVMNVPGVLEGEPALAARLGLARERGLLIDGHAPGLRGEPLRRYVQAGPSTDHECTTLEEAREKLALGVRILLREGSAARDLDALHPLVSEAPGRVMLCSDDRHPDDLVAGHIDGLCARLVALGHGPLEVLRAASTTAAEHYRLPIGQLQPGDPADFLVLDAISGPRAFAVREAWIAGRKVAEAGRSLLPRRPAAPLGRLAAAPLGPGSLRVPAPPSPRARVMAARDGSLLTEALHLDLTVRAGLAVADPGRDLLKIAVVSRYAPGPPAVAFARGFGLRAGAIASSVAHDSHNLVAVGADDRSLIAAINAIIEAGGGLAVCDGHAVDLLPLPIAGLMSDGDGDEVAARYAQLNAAARALGSTLRAPLMTLSFMSLLVVPALKLSDRGLFDGLRWTPTPLWVADPQ